MNILKVNNLEMEVISYNRNTYFSAGGISSNASCAVKTLQLAALRAMAEEPITSIQIISDNKLIYDLSDINAKIDSINEYLNGNQVDVGINFSFVYEEEEANENNSEPV